MSARLRWLIAVGAYAGMAWAQAPVEEGRRPPDAVLDAQQKAGAAYRDWQNAQATRAAAEEELKRTVATYQAAQQQLNDAKQRTKDTQQKLVAAKEREIATRHAYDKAITAVDRAWGGK